MFGIWPTLIDPKRHDLLEATASYYDPTSATAITRLRKRWPTDLVRGAVALTIARRKATGKFDCPEHLVADPVGVEQATGTDVAAHKARRFAEAGIDRIFDLCCGIGGDAMALADIADVTVVDMNPERVWMARRNVQSATGRRPSGIVADISTLSLPSLPFHIDPARRTSEGRRRHRFEDAQPGPVVIRALIDRAQDSAVKLSPGIAFDTLPPGEVEIINRNGTLIQAVLWTGRLSQAHDHRTATRLPDGISLTGPSDLSIPCETPSRYLLAIDPAIERAGLIGLLCRQLNLPAVHPALGLLTADHPVSNPWLTPYELIEAMPWREKKVAAWLRAHDVGEVVVKTRDKVVDPDIVSLRLRGEGRGVFTVFVLRVGKKVVAWVTRRVTRGL